MARRLAYAAIAVVALVLLTASYTWYTYMVFDVSAYNAIGDGITNNNQQIQAAANGAGVAGGVVRLPCGTFKLTTQITQTIPAGKTVSWMGSGSCTVLYFSGSNGLLENLQSSFSTVSVSDMVFATDAVGTYTALTWSQPPTNGTYFATNNTLSNVVFQGYDFAGTQTEYWSVGFTQTGVSNLNIYGGQCNMLTQHGTCYSVAGSGLSPFPTSVQINFFGTIINQCNVGLFYGSHTEGVTLNAVNMTGCNYGVKTDTTADMDQLSITQSQFNTNIYAIDIENSGFFELLVSQNVFIVNGGSGIKLQGGGHSITNNYAASVNAQAAYFLNVLTGTGALVSGNVVGDFHYLAYIGPGVNSQANFIENKVTLFPVSGTPVSVVATESGGVVTALTPTLTAGLYPYQPIAVIQGASCQGVTATVQSTNENPGWLITGVTLTNGGTGACTAAPTVGIQSAEKFYVDPSSSGTFIADSQPQNFEDLPYCGSSGPLVTGTKFTVIDGQPETFNAAIKGGSGGIFTAFCQGVWLGH